MIRLKSGAFDRGILVSSYPGGEGSEENVDRVFYCRHRCHKLCGGGLFVDQKQAEARAVRPMRRKFELEI